MRHSWHCIMDLPNRGEAPVTKPCGLIRQDDEMTLAATPHTSEITVDPYNPSKYWDYFGGTD